MNKQLYPRVEENYTVIKQDGDSIIHMNAGYDIDILEKTGYMYETMNKTAAELLALCTGLNTIESLCEQMRSKYRDTTENVDSFVSEFVLQCVEKGYVELMDQPNETRANFFGDFTLVTPIFAAIEVTKQCPLRCKHCFNDSGNMMEDELSLLEMVKVLDILHQIGVQKIQLTGGEPTARADFQELLLHAVQKFSAISIATNGYYITPEIVDLIASHKNNIIVQVSIDGSQENHDRFRAVKGSYKKATDAVRSLSSRGVVVLVSTSVSDQNFDDLEHLPNLAMSLGATQLVISPTVEQGRAKKKNILEDVSFEDIMSKTKELHSKYSGKGIYISYEEDAPGNDRAGQYCGAGKSIVAIRSNGDVSPCVAFNHTYGNLLRDQVGDIFNRFNSEMYGNIPLPSASLCGDCDLLMQKCMSCNARAFDSSSYILDCRWKTTLDYYMENFCNDEARIH